jgi:hypothetical protein
LPFFSAYVILRKNCRVSRKAPRADMDFSSFSIPIALSISVNCFAKLQAMIEKLNLENILFLDIETVPVEVSHHLLDDEMKELWEHKTQYQRKDQ